MRQYYIGQHIVYMKRYWVVTKISRDSIEVKSLKSNAKGWHRMLTFYNDIPTPMNWAVKISDYEALLKDKLPSIEL